MVRVRVRVKVRGSELEELGRLLVLLRPVQQLGALEELLGRLRRPAS